MFEDRLEAAIGSPADLVRLAADTHDELKVAGCRKLLVAAAWADAHSAVERSRRCRRTIRCGPSGWWRWARSAARRSPKPVPPSLAVAFQTSIGGAKG